MFRDWELASAEKSWNNDMYFDKENISRWKSNNSVPMNDMLDKWKFLNKEFDYDKAVEARQKQVEYELEEYRKSMKNYVPSTEKISEMQNEFGKSTTVINIITEQKIML